MWVDTPWKYVLWAVGLGLDLGAGPAPRGELDRRRPAGPGAGADRQRSRPAQGGWPPGRREAGRAEADPVQVSVVGVNPDHLQERLGLFVIIVLGEVVSQLVFAASTREWARDFAGSRWRRSSSWSGCGGSPSAMASAGRRTRGWRCCSPGSACPCTCSPRWACSPWQRASARWRPSRNTTSARRCAGSCAPVCPLHFLVMTISGVTGGAPPRWLLGWGMPCTARPGGARRRGVATSRTSRSSG